MSECTLNNIKVGDSACVTRIGLTGPLKRRLIDMGITPGVKIKIKKYAPLGDPIEIELRGYELSIRRSEAKNIYVNPCGREV
ncbi:FeoA family protein [Porcipelethomonas sp.]|uniref:FeoA family protein n=1 Tax=Porcipelethomonas sp. TaxID=2981675 RepID=UPI003EF978C6